MNIEQLKQLKGVELTTKTGEAYARIRLGLDDSWIVYAWSSIIEDLELRDEEEYYDNLENTGGLQEIISDVVNEAIEVYQLPKDQMYVKLVKANTIEEAKANWRNKVNMEEAICIIDWALVQAL